MMKAHSQYWLHWGLNPGVLNPEFTVSRSQPVYFALPGRDRHRDRERERPPSWSRKSPKHHDCEVPVRLRRRRSAAVEGFLLRTRVRKGGWDVGAFPVFSFLPTYPKNWDSFPKSLATDCLPQANRGAGWGELSVTHMSSQVRPHGFPLLWSACWTHR